MSRFRRLVLSLMQGVPRPKKTLEGDNMLAHHDKGPWLEVPSLHVTAEHQTLWSDGTRIKTPWTCFPPRVIKSPPPETSAIYHENMKTARRIPHYSSACSNKPHTYANKYPAGLPCSEAGCCHPEIANEVQGHEGLIVRMDVSGHVVQVCVVPFCPKNIR